jgi:hypothetical protein
MSAKATAVTHGHQETANTEDPVLSHLVRSSCTCGWVMTCGTAAVGWYAYGQWLAHKKEEATS